MIRLFLLCYLFFPRTHNIPFVLFCAAIAFVKFGEHGTLFEKRFRAVYWKVILFILIDRK